MDEEPATAVRRDRFSGGPARSFLSSMDADERIFAADLAVDRAHVVMLDEQDILESETAGAILSALDAIEEAGYDALPDAEDIHEAIETQVIEEVGDIGGTMHTARSRNDEVATCIRYRLREDLLDLTTTITDLRAVLAAVAERHVETIMPGYTHLQPAQPITVAHWACSYERTLARDVDRFLDTYDRVNQSPLGGAAFAGTPFPIDRELTAALLGFDGIVENAMDASASRDTPAEALGETAMLAVTLSGIAEDVILFSHRGFLDLEDDFASTSSIMPQKKNPDTLELVRATAGEAVGSATGLLTTLKGLPRAYNRDLQQASTHLWETIDLVNEATRVTAGALDTAVWDQSALEAAAGEGFPTATGVADLLAMHGIPFRTAHKLVATAADVDADDRVSAIEQAAAIVLDEDLWSPVDQSDLETVLDPAGSVASRDSTGGPAASAVLEQLETVQADLESDVAAIEQRESNLARARAQLAREVEGRV